MLIIHASWIIMHAFIVLIIYQQQSVVKVQNKSCMRCLHPLFVARWHQCDVNASDLFCNSMGFGAAKFVHKRPIGQWMAYRPLSAVARPIGLSGPPVCCCWNADRGLSALERPIWSLSRMVSKASELECEINDLICRLNLVSTSTMFYVTPLGQFCCH